MLKNFCMRRTLISITLSCYFLVSFMTSVPISSVSAYTSGLNATHQFIFEQARTILRNDGYTSYADFLDSVEPSSGLSYFHVMIKGNDENDVYLPDAREHYMDPMDHKGLWLPGIGYQKSAGTLCQERFDEAVSCWKRGDLYNALYNLGWAAHLVHDVCVPHHAWTTAVNWHAEYEKWVDDNKHNYAVDSNGIYSFPSFPDLDYYLPTNGHSHYSWVNVSAFDWVDFNAHESLKYHLCVGGSYAPINDLADPYVETIHPLPNNLETTLVITTYNAPGMQLYFENIDLESGFDYIYIYDKYDNLLDELTGQKTDFLTDWYPVGDTLKIKLETDSTVQSWGYKITEVRYNSNGNYDHDETLLHEATNVLLPLAQRSTAGFIKFFFDPLWSMFHSFNTSIGYNVDVFSNSTIENFEYFESNSTIKMYVSNMTTDQTHGFCRLTIPYDLLSPPYNIIINDDPVTYTTLYKNETLNIIYFSYEHSTLEIIIVPEFPSFLILSLLMIATLLAVIGYRRKHPMKHKLIS